MTSLLPEHGRRVAGCGIAGTPPVYGLGADLGGDRARPVLSDLGIHTVFASPFVNAYVLKPNIKGFVMKSKRSPSSEAATFNYLCF